MTVSIIAPLASAETSAPRPILGVDRRTGAFVALVPSSSQPNVFHITTATSCSCKGFSYRKSCRHIAPPANDLRDGSAAHLAVLRAEGSWPTKPALSADVAATAATYFDIFGGQE